jgi:hypothetical protein
MSRPGATPLVSRWFGTLVAATGWTEEEGEAAGVNPERNTRKEFAKTARIPLAPPTRATMMAAVQSRLGRSHPMAGTDGGRLHGLADEQTVFAALDAIDR